MKKIKMLTAALALLALLPTAGFALADISAFGGYSWGTSDTIDPSGFQYGFDAHINTEFLYFFQLGLGGFYKKSDMELSYFDRDVDYNRSTAGIDAYAQLELPLIPIDPYVRFRSAVWEKVSGQVIDNTEYFKSYSVGGGIFLTVLPVPGVIKLQLFGEYLYDITKQDGHKVNGHTFNLGVRADVL